MLRCSQRVPIYHHRTNSNGIMNFTLISMFANVFGAEAVDLDRIVEPPCAKNAKNAVHFQFGEISRFFARDPSTFLCVCIKIRSDTANLLNKKYCILSLVTRNHVVFSTYRKRSSSQCSTSRTQQKWSYVPPKP